MRRAHCALNDQDQLLAILNEATIGRLATTDDQGYPYITPVNFVFYQGRIYFHCAAKGEKLDNIARDPRVCFEVDIPLSYIEVAFNEQRSPCNTHQYYRSVVIRGQARVVEDEPLKITALNALVAKHEGHSNFPPVTADSPNARACRVVEVTPERMTGKADLVQNKPEDQRRQIAGLLAHRGRPEDLTAIKAMGFEPFQVGSSGWRIK